MFKDTDDCYKLSSGNIVFANCHYIGLAPKDSEGWEIAGGYDQIVSYDSIGNIGNKGEYTKAELVEIADYMIELWGKFRRDASNHKDEPANPSKEDV